MNSGRGNQYLGKACPPRPDGFRVATDSQVERPDIRDRFDTEAEPVRRAIKRTGSLKRTSGLKPGRSRRVRPGGKDAAAEWRTAALERVFATYGYIRDEATGQTLTSGEVEVHHVLEAGDLWSRRVATLKLPAADGREYPLVWHPDNAMVLHKTTHARHHSRQAPIPLVRLRAETLDLAKRLDELAGDEWWSVRLATDYKGEA